MVNDDGGTDENDDENEIGMVRQEMGEKKRKRIEDGEGSPWELGILSGKERVRSVVIKGRDTFRFTGMDYYNEGE